MGRCMLARHTWFEDMCRGTRVVSEREAGRLGQVNALSAEEGEPSTSCRSALALVHGTVMPQHVADEALGNPEVQRLSAVLSMDEDNYANRLFPLQRMARAEITLHAGDILKSGWFEPKWDAATPPTQGELEEKFHAYTGPVLGQARSDALHLAVMSLDKTEAQPLLDLLYQPLS